ncbi:glycosyltransferase [Mariprofundus sp. EBB-1]|uniref:WecB/TagA/CpsF family glycosyltransferase n=1 Tax=Mariprofundus sp. EBB-1 TaxID=2650971 RepID=UPI000EF1DA38|nr:WecB/TagA/CpsF family glycosyltransferase [Mariprofundus sp. EBB-1]RLL55879.1 glycosyltransferase [Mariprofundus sp. EBB-1]
MGITTENIIGYSVSVASLTEHLNQICDWIDSGERGRYFVCANPHSLVVADSDPAFSQVIREADMVTPDGSGILLASKILGGSICERVTGTDVFLGLSKSLNESGGASCFFLGASEETLEKIKVKMAEDFPNVTVAGTYSPPYKPEFSEEENAAMIAAINQAKPDVLWVGMTAPKQEKWIHDNIGKLDVKFAGAIGAVFDFYVGNVKRSHPVFQKLGLEWLPRLLQEPRRLWRRNFVSSPLFLLKVMRQKLSGKS